MVNVHDLTVFAPITSLEKARGATMFVLDLQVKCLTFDIVRQLQKVMVNVMVN